MDARKGSELMDSIVKAVTGAVAGAVLGWAASTMTTALTLVGRVAAIEAGQARIEAQLVQLLSRSK